MSGDTLRVVIVDDEPLARTVVREYLKHHPGVEVVAECANGFDAVKAVTELSPDLMFLDVQMPKLNGFEVLELIGRHVPVIFTTAYDQYALARLRGSRRGLPPEAVQRGAVRRGADARAGAACSRTSRPPTSTAWSPTPARSPGRSSGC